MINTPMSECRHAWQIQLWNNLGTIEFKPNFIEPNSDWLATLAISYPEILIEISGDRRSR